MPRLVIVADDSITHTNGYPTFNFGECCCIVYNPKENTYLHILFLDGRIYETSASYGFARQVAEDHRCLREFEDFIEDVAERSDYKDA